MRRALIWLALVALGLAAAAPAGAHTRSETHSNWEIAGRTVRLVFTVPDLELRRLDKLGMATPAGAAAYIQPRLSASSRGGACRRLGPARPQSAGEGYTRYELAFECPDAADIAVRSDAFFDLVPTHVNFAQIRTSSGDFIEQLITADHRTLSASASSGGELQNAGFLDYVRLGVMHIFTGVDHQLFLVGLVLLSRRLRDLLFVITGFTLGHSVTLALAVTGVLRPHAEFIDALIGLTIALVGAEIVAESTGRPGAIAIGVLALTLTMALGDLVGLRSMPVALLIGGGMFGANYLMVAGHLRDAARLRLAVTLVFGLIHGFGFAAGLLEMQLPAGRLAELLVGFNLGVEIGQVTLVLAVVGLGALLARTRIAAMRPLAGELAASFLVAIGLFWFVSRGYAAGGTLPG